MKFEDKQAQGKVKSAEAEFCSASQLVPFAISRRSVFGYILSHPSFTPKTVIEILLSLRSFLPLMFR